MKRFRLLGPDGIEFESDAPGAFGGVRTRRIYGRLDCRSALRALIRTPTTYRKHRVFFLDEASAIAAGYRPCARCLPGAYTAWKLSRAASGTATS